MKAIFMTLAVIALVAGQLFFPVQTVSASTSCGDTYLVQPGDYLARIAGYCGTTVASILALNPQIYNPSLIYSGTVLRLTGSAPLPTPTYPYSGYARVYLSTRQADIGDEVLVSVSGFPANSEIDYRLGQVGADFSVIYDGTVGAYGSASETITIPAAADLGEYWVVEVVTTSSASVVQASSATIYITDYTTYIPYTGSARVSLSKTQAAVGDTVTVTVSGFPVNAEIDYRLGQQSAAFSVVYDGETGSSGTDSMLITIPADADVGEYWVVLVITTSQQKVVQVTSHTIYITD